MTLAPRPDAPHEIQPEGARARRAAFLLIGALLIVLIAHLIVGLPAVIVYGLAGGIAICLVTLGLDRLHAVERRLARRDTSPGETELPNKQ